MNANSPSLFPGNIKLITRNDWVPCAGAQCCVITTLTTSDTERYTQIQLHKKEFRVPVRSHLWHAWHGEVQKCHPVQWLTATQNIHFWVPVIVNFTHYRYSYFPYTGLYPAQGPRGKRPELESQLTSNAASSKKTTIPGFLPPARAHTSLTLVPRNSGHFPRTWKPVSLHNQHHICIGIPVR